MKRFEYDTSFHRADEFKELVYFCSSTGSCSAEEVTADQREVLKGILDGRGREGWELVQIIARREGLMAVWKRGTE